MGHDAYTPITSRTRLPRPLNGWIYTTTRGVASEKPLPALGGTMAAELGATSVYAANTIVGVTDGPDKSKGILTITHVSIPSEADQLKSSWEATTADMGGKKFPAGTTSVVRLASAIVGHELTATAGVGPFADYTADDSAIVESGTQLEPMFRVIKTNWVKTSPMVSRQFDEATGGMLETTQTLVKGVLGEDQVGGMSGNAVTEYSQLTATWYMTTVRQVVSAALAAGRTYTSTVDYYWPAVLDYVQIDPWPLRAGGVDVHVSPVYKRDAYRGPCKATIYEKWAATAPTPSVPGVLSPLPIALSTPILAISIQPTLHTQQDFDLSTGSDHPVYDYAGGSFTFEATNYTDWPATVIKSDEVRPMRGGCLRTTVTAYRPVAT